MKTICINRLRIVFACALSLLFPALGGAQQQMKNGYANVDWQFNIPINNGFAEKSSGWGMNFEGGYYFTPNMGVGLFMAFHTNNEYIPTQTLNLSSSSRLTTDQQHCLFQLPFGAAFRYRFMPEKKFSPYVGLKLGAQYAKATTYYNVYSSSNEKGLSHVARNRHQHLPDGPGTVWLPCGIVLRVCHKPEQTAYL